MISKALPMEPLVSIIMPVYNAARYLREAVDSIINQTYSRWECIIVDDFSQDDTPEIIKEYTLKDSRIGMLNGTQNGIAAALNLGISQAKGSYIARMDADDISMPERLAEQAAYMEKNPDIDICGSNYIKFFCNGKKENVTLPEHNEDVQANLLFSCVLCHPTVMVRKKIFDNGWHYDGQVKTEDYDLWLRLVPNIKFYNIQKTLLNYRASLQSASHADAENVYRCGAQLSQKAICRLFHMDIFKYKEDVFGNNGFFEYVKMDFFEFIRSQLLLFAELKELNNKWKVFKGDCLNAAMENRWKSIFQYCGMDDKFLDRAKTGELGSINALLHKKGLLHQYEKKIETLEKYLNNLVSGNGKTAVYGMGVKGKRVLERYISKGSNIHSLLLIDKTVTEIGLADTTYAVCRPEALLTSDVNYVLITSDNFYEEIRSDILKLGIKEDRIFNGNLIWAL